MQDVAWEAFRAQGFPGLYPGDVVTTSHTTGWLGKAIRLAESFGQGEPAERSHTMLYAGAGNVLSQNWHLEEQPLSDWAGADLTFWHNPAWTRDEKAALVAHMRDHLGERYDWLGLVGQLGYSLTGWEWFRAHVQAPYLTYCSERVCTEIRRHRDPGFLAGYPNCQVTPDEIDRWCAAAGWRETRLNIRLDHQ
ncbi:MAG: hypothetical protein KQJ78_10945 [Deltaproteobacteria bacterium]|nr:hypothetical protein [Deltaproteobacteria bacterium]